MPENERHPAESAKTIASMVDVFIDMWRLSLGTFGMD